MHERGSACIPVVKWASGIGPPFLSRWSKRSLVGPVCCACTPPAAIRACWFGVQEKEALLQQVFQEESSAKADVDWLRHQQRVSTWASKYGSRGLKT